MRSEGPFDVILPGGPLPLEGGGELPEVTLRVESWGELNPQRSNAILLLHAFSGDAHAAGKRPGEAQDSGWWASMVGPGMAFDTDRYCIYCSNVLGGCRGSTGPTSIKPGTDEPWGMDFPVITIGDMVAAQIRLSDALGIPRWLAVAGGSMGGMQALEWAVRAPDRVSGVITIAATGRLSPQAIAFNAVGRNAIMQDSRWNQGRYYGTAGPELGLAIARMVGHITYLSDESMHRKFGRRLQTRTSYGFDFSEEFEVESYLAYQGRKFVDRFDANTYIYLSKAMDYFDLSGGTGDLYAALAPATAAFLVLSYRSDWLFPTYQSLEIVHALGRLGSEVSHVELDSPYGHDSFLLDIEGQSRLISAFLAARTAVEGNAGTATGTAAQ